MNEDDNLTDPQEPGKIQGYRKVPQAEIDLVNEIKDVENQVGEVVAKVKKHFQESDFGVDDWVNRVEDLDHSIFTLQSGFMWLVRTVMQPESKLK